MKLNWRSVRWEALICRNPLYPPRTLFGINPGLHSDSGAHLATLRALVFSEDAATCSNSRPRLLSTHQWHSISQLRDTPHVTGNFLTCLRCALIFSRLTLFLVLQYETHVAIALIKLSHIFLFRNKYPKSHWIRLVLVLS